MSVGSKIGWRLPGLWLLKEDIRNSHLLEWLMVKGLVALNGEVLKTNTSRGFQPTWLHTSVRALEISQGSSECRFYAYLCICWVFYLTERILSHAFFLWKSVVQYLAWKRFVFTLSEVNENQWLDFSSEISRLYSVAPFNVLYLQRLLYEPKIH